MGRVTAKRLELLNEVIPSLHRAGVLLICDSEINGPSMELMEERGKALGVELAVLRLTARWSSRALSRGGPMEKSGQLSLGTTLS